MQGKCKNHNYEEMANVNFARIHADSSMFIKNKLTYFLEDAQKTSAIVEHGQGIGCKHETGNVF